MRGLSFPCLVIWLTFLTLYTQADQRRLFILHTNDTHGYIESYEKGGLERIAALVGYYREMYPGQVLLLDGGDTSLGTPLSGTFYGKPTAELIDLMNYDAVALGNHEFNWGKDKMQALTLSMNTPVLCANLVTEDGSPQPYAGFTVVERNGVKLGIFGLVTPDTPRRAPVESTRDWKFLEPALAARVALAGMPDDVDAVISLNHLGVAADKDLAQAVPEIDMIVGGHSHSALSEELYQGQTPIVQAGCYGEYLGVAEIEVDTEEDTLRLLNYRLIPALEAEPDEQAHLIIERYAAELRPLMRRKIATVSERLNKHAPDNSYDTPLGNFISDVFRDQASTDIALYNRGGVRFSMEPGPLTVAQVFELFPFDDPVNVLEATGAQIKLVIEQGTVDGEGPVSTSGLTAVIRDQTVSDIRVNGKPLDPKSIYTIATTRFLSDGGDGMAALSALKRVRTLPFTRDVLQQYLETHSEIHSPGAGRLLID
jgi:2',3'-cyclic-nucleotide 2'-phosphodiesterase (5'-nucleotidase family)